jgi:hypothetical protein
VVAGSYLLGPISVPSNRRNLTSIGSFPPAIARPVQRPAPTFQSSQDPRNHGSEVHGAEKVARNPQKSARRRILTKNSCFRVVWGLKARGRRLGQEGRKVEKTRDPAVVGLAILTDTLQTQISFLSAMYEVRGISS